MGFVKLKNINSFLKEREKSWKIDLVVKDQG